MFHLSRKLNTGMTYLELIIVLSIFATVSGIVLFSYKEFQEKVDIKNLTNEIALKIVEAQKLSLSGKLSVIPPTVSPWKPSYGVAFDINTPQSFIYFVDLNNSGTCSDPGCVPPYSLGGEVIEIVTMNRGNSIPVDGINPTGIGCPANIPNISAVFKRPNSSPILSSNSALTCVPDYVGVTVVSLSGKSGVIKIYPSGRIQIN